MPSKNPGENPVYIYKTVEGAKATVSTDNNILPNDESLYYSI